MKKRDYALYEELRLGALYTAEHLTPAPGAIPRIPGIDIYGTTIPYNGLAGGDLISYINFQDRYDLDARISRAAAQGQENVVQALKKIKRGRGGILVADVAGHDFSDAMRALMLHQVFYTAALYEMDLNGEITVRAFEQINTRFLKSTTLRNLAADRDIASYITLIYGEISHSGRFHFVSAGHPPPLVFSREFNRFVEISQDRLVSYPPIGLQPSEDYADASHYHRNLGYKKHYEVNKLNLMGQGDILFLYTDGLLDPFSSFRQEHMEQTVSRTKDACAKEICEAILEDRNSMVRQKDDLSLAVIKRS